MTFKRIARGLGWGLVVLLGLVSLVIGVLWVWPVASRPPPTEVVERTAERLARGRYVFHHVANCAFCHSEHDATRYAWPVVASRLGAGFCASLAPGEPEECMPNITSHPTAGVGAWTDGELIRAIREGVHRDGRALVGMPFDLIRSMSDEDTRAVVAYLRTLPPLDTVRPPISVPFPLNLVMKRFPQPLEEPVPSPPQDDPVRRGEYLASVAQCAGCHAGDDGTPFAGGQPMWSPFGEAIASNLTPDPKTGLGGWTREQFVARFQSVADMGQDAPAGPGDSAMPWESYAGMSEEDLGALFAYLQSLPPAVRQQDAVAGPTAP